MTDLSDRAVAIVGHCLDHYRDTVRPVAFIRHLIVVRSLALAHAAFDRAIDRVVRHVRAFGIRDRFTKSRVRVDIAAPAGAGCDGDLFDHLREDLAALGVERAFLMLNCVPLGMS